MKKKSLLLYLVIVITKLLIIVIELIIDKSTECMYVNHEYLQCTVPFLQLY